MGFADREGAGVGEASAPADLRSYHDLLRRAATMSNDERTILDDVVGKFHPGDRQLLLKSRAHGVHVAPHAEPAAHGNPGDEEGGGTPGASPTSDDGDDVDDGRQRLAGLAGWSGWAGWAGGVGWLGPLLTWKSLCFPKFFLIPWMDEKSRHPQPAKTLYKIGLKPMF